MLISSITGILECFALALQKPQVREERLLEKQLIFLGYRYFCGLHLVLVVVCFSLAVKDSYDNFYVDCRNKKGEKIVEAAGKWSFGPQLWNAYPFYSRYDFLVTPKIAFL
ncbi:hypothetical protein M9H77_07097 [Catharanthus roseus]|uniref:Uncharacterized protein n=1 Tax=Catharanthus roseus TaxID=4058 RepID=A0ACC0BTZ1_CATRO|nr:hypothetical protein M9H77_07097 [Catharanthus roseus]